LSLNPYPAASGVLAVPVVNVPFVPVEAAGHEGTAAVDAKNPVLLKVELTGVLFAGLTVELVACETLTATAT